MGWSFAELLPCFNRLETDLRYGAEPYHGDSGPIPIYRAPLSRWGAVDQALAEAALELRSRVRARSQRAARARRLAVRDQQPRRRARQHQRRLPRAEPRAPESRRSSATRTSIACCSKATRAVGVRYRRAGEWHELRARTVLLVRGRGALAGDPAALGHRSAGAARGARHRAARRPARRRAAPGSPAGRVRGRCCATTRAAARLPPHQLLRALQLGTSRRGSRRHDDRGDESPRRQHRPAPAGRGRAAGVRSARRVGERVRLARHDPARVARSARRPGRDREHARLDQRPRAHARRRAPTDRDRAPSGAERAWARSAAWGSTSTATRPTTRSTAGRSPPSATRSTPPAPAAWATRATPTTVVDPECRVLGVDALRVIDASIMPSVVRANTHLTTVMIAERMAEQTRALARG